MYQLTDNPEIVHDLDTGAFVPVVGNWQSDVYQEWLAAGNTPLPAPGKVLADYVAEYSSAVQAWLDDVVQANGYDDMASCATYAASSVAQWRADAQAAIAWRDAVWQSCFAWQAQAAQALPDPIPTVAQFIAGLPQPAAYGWTVHATGQAS